MTCTQCLGIEDLFSEEYVAKELKDYRRRGPDKTTRILIEALKKENVEGQTLLDIGGGLGTIQHEMLSAGVQHATDIDASNAYIKAAKAESTRRGYAGQVDYQHGNFVDLAADIPPVDIVTLNRVICCYPDMQKMVSLSVSRADKLYGLVYPRDVWWTKIGLAIQNFVLRLQRSRFRTYLHPTDAVEALIRRNGFERRFYKKTFIWQIAVFSR